MSWYVSVELDNGEFHTWLIEADEPNQAQEIVEDWCFSMGDEIVEMECQPAV